MSAKTILFVDDDLENMSDHVRMLEDAGFAVTQRRTTDEALDDFLDQRAANYDLVILDMMIPPPDGDRYKNIFQVWDGLRSGGHLLYILRQQADQPQPPVLLLSNLPDGEVLLEGWEQFVTWCARHERPVPSASTDDGMAHALQEQFATWVRGKRRTPPWHLPRLAREITAETSAR